MFLVTTADQRFWKKDEKILFLGEWCRTIDQKHVWSKLNYEVLPYHWENRDRYHQDFLYLDGLYERYLDKLSDSMNACHEEKHSKRYWRLVISPWLYYFIEILYDKYLSVRSAIDTGRVQNTWVPSLTPDKYVPKDFAAFQKWQFGDSFNQYLYGLMISSLGEISWETQDQALQLDQGEGHESLSLKKVLKKVSKNVLEGYSHFIPKSLNQVVFISSYLKAGDLFRLQLSLGQLPYPCSPWVDGCEVDLDFEKRKKIELPQGRNEFEKLLQKIIPFQIPMVNLEGYTAMKQRALSKFPKEAKVIFTVNAYYGNEGFKFWAADQVERGAKLVGTQHGGHYGTALWSANETHEKKVADRYFTWGWKESGEVIKTIPLVSGQLAGTKEKIDFEEKGGILWLGMSRPRYSNWMFSAPVGSQMLEYIQDQLSFIEDLSLEIQNLLTMRLFNADYGWGIKEQLSAQFPNLYFDPRDKNMYQKLCKSRLAIGTYNATTNLEILSANFPIVAFWNFDHWPLREAAKPYFEDLCKVGIFHKTPESAAAKVNEIYKDPLQWWRLSSVQDARKKFCHRFARTSENWMGEWKEKLQKLAKN